MEFDTLSERGEWGSRRVAAAFGIEHWTRLIIPNPDTSDEFDLDEDAQRIIFAGETEKALVFVYWSVDGLTIEFEYGERKREGDHCFVGIYPTGDCSCVVWDEYSEMLARGLYRLGVETEDVLAQLDYPLTTHEKMELRLSMPREFWPKTWLDEEERS